MKKSLRLDKVIVELKERDGSCRNQDTKKRVEDFMLSDSNSICVPDTKVKAGTRYRLSSLELLHLTFLSECDSVDDEISYPHFTKVVPENIIKPKPESWGTCLCMPCINTELKVSAVNKNVTPCGIDHLDDDALDIVCNELVR